MSGAQPLEVTDFSGGITENILNADPRRYQYGDNFIITNDKKLRPRAPFVPLIGNLSTFPTGTQRITSLFSWINETLLVGQSEKNFFWLDTVTPQWTQILGVNGNPVLSGANVYAQTSFAEFQKQIIVTSDGGADPYGSLPVNLYQNTTNAWVARTAGLPRSFSVGNYTYATLLNRCIAMANALRASMVSHFADAQNQTWSSRIGLAQLPQASVQSDYLHFAADTVALSYFQSVSFAPNEPAINANPGAVAGVATDQPTLYKLVQAMNAAYGFHIADAMIGSYNESPTVNSSATAHNMAVDGFSINYHHYMKYVAQQPPIKGPLAQLTSSAVTALPTDTTKQFANLTTIATQLDDLNQKWYWHQLAVNTHDPYNQFGKINRYMADQTPIGTVLSGTGAPVISPDFTDFINYVNNLTTIWSGHIGVNGPHTQQANALVSYIDGTLLDTQITLPAATDLNSAYLLIYWLRAMYHVHYLDASIADFSTFTCNATTAGSPSIPVVVFPVTGVVGKAGQWVFNNRIDTGGVFNATLNSNINTKTYGVQTQAAQIILVSGTTWTVDRAFKNSGYVKNFQVSSSKYHSFNTAGALDSTTVAKTTANELLASGPIALGSSLSTWGALASEFFNTVGSHAFNTAIHASNADIATTLPPVPVYQVDVTNIWKTYSINACTTPFFTPTIASYAYAFCYAYTYNVGVGGIQYTVRSNPVISGSLQGPTSLPVGATIVSPNINLYPSVVNQATRGFAITVLPVLANTNETNYDLANVKLEVYRTTSGGTTYFLNNLLANGVTSYTDTANDTIQVGTFGAQSLQTPIYITGGVVGSDQPPKSKFIHILNGTAYYGGIYDAGQFFPNRVRQAVNLAPEWVPASFNDDLDDDITCITSAKDVVVVGCKNSIYRLGGAFSSSGQGGLTHERIADSIGFLNAKSAVRTEIGVFFAGNDGFYYTDGYQIIKISLEFDKAYAGFTQSDAQKKSIYGAYDKTTRRVWWSLRASQNDTDNSVMYVFYLNYGVKPSGVFTTASNFPFLRPSSLVFQQGKMFIGHEYGFVLTADANQKQDYAVQSGVTPANWNRIGIPYNYTSCAVDMGTTFKRKWFTKLHLVGNNVGNVGAQINVIRDMNSDGNGITAMTPINYTDNCVWGTATCVWGDATQIWNNLGKMDLWRRFPATSLRGDFVQIQIVPAKVAVYASGIGYPFGADTTVDSAAKTATILTPSGYTSIVFMPDVVGYAISFQSDAYIKEYAITALDATSKIITYSDAGNTSTNGTVGWVIRGIKKEQRLEINSYVIHYMLLGDKTQRYPGKTNNTGPGNAGENNS